MSKPVQLFPYEMSTALSIRLTDFDEPAAGRPIDVREVRSGEEDDDGDSSVSATISGYDAYSAGASWRKLAFRVTSQLSATELERVLPSTSSVETDTALLLLITCPATKFRHGVKLKPTHSGTWTGPVGFQRDDVKGSVSVRAQLVRTNGIPGSEELPFATKAGAVIAMSNPVTVWIDVEPASPGVLNSTVSTSWEDFTNSDHVWRREHPNDVYHLEPFGHEPHLYLNSRYSQLRDIMEVDAKRGPEAVLRDMTAAMIAQPVLLQLGTVAITSLEIDEDSGSVSTPPGWRGTLLASMLPLLYPEVASDEERLVRASREIHESDGAASLLGRLGSVVQEMIASYKTIEAAVRAHESVRDKDDANDD